MTDMHPQALDPRAFEAERSLRLASVYRVHRAYVRRHLRGFGVPGERLEDALHDVFLVAFTRLHDYDGARGSMSAWLIGIAWRVAAAHRRKAARTVGLEDSGRPLDLATDIPDPEAYAARLEAGRVLEDVLRALPCEQAAAFVMAELEGWSGREIAERLNVAPATAYTRVARARAKLKSELDRTRLGSRPWWAILWWPRGASTPGVRLVAAFVSLRALVGVAVGIVALAAVWWTTRSPAEGKRPTVVSAALGEEGLGGRSIPARHASRTSFGLRAQVGALFGRVGARSGAAIAGARACLWPHIPEHGEQGPRCTTTSGDGRFRFEAVVPSRYRVTASAEGFLPGEATDTEGLPRSVVLRAGVSAPGVEITLDPGGQPLRGMVTDVLGGAIEGATVRLLADSLVGPGTDRGWGSGPPIQATTDAEGSFVVWARKDQYDVIAIADGYGDTSVDAKLPGPTVRIAMVPESTLAGIVRERGSNTPVPHARVSIREWAGGASKDRFVATADADGHFLVGGLSPGRYRLVAVAERLHGESGHSHLVDLGEATEDIVIEMSPAAALAARVVVEPDGTPCPSGQIRLWDHAGGVTVSASIEPDGAAMFDALAGGEYSVMVDCDEHNGAGVPPLHTVESGTDTEVVWSVTKGYAIRGHVVDVQGQPIVGHVSGYAADGGDGARRVRIGSDGGYVLRGLVPGTYAVNALTDGTWGAALKAQATIVDRDVTLDFEAPVRRSISGRVFRGDAPAGGVEVRAERSGAFHASVSTDDEGVFIFGALDPDEYTFVARDRFGHRSESRSQHVTLDSDLDPLELTLPPSATVQGVVVDDEGAPVQNAIVAARLGESLATEGARQASILAAPADGVGTALSGPDGTFALHGVAPMTDYTLVAYRRGGGSGVLSGVRAGSKVKVLIPTSGAVRGRVRGPSAPTSLWVSAQRIHDSDATNIVREPFVLSEGVFEISDLAPGSYEILAWAREGRARSRIELLPGATVELELDLVGHRTLLGRFVRLETGAPIPEVVTVFDLENASIQELGAQVDRLLKARLPGRFSDASGRFVATSVPREPVNMLAISKGFQFAPTDVLEGIFVPVDASETEYEFPIATPRLAPGETSGTLGLTLSDAPMICRESFRVRAIDEATVTGIVVGDEVVTIDGYDVSGARCYLVEKLLAVPAGRTVALGLRSGETARITAR